MSLFKIPHKPSKDANGKDHHHKYLYIIVGKVKKKFYGFSYHSPILHKAR